jgi:uncharacterized protein (UPF0548 family)
LFTLTQPTEDQLRSLIEKNRDAPFSYPAVGATRDGSLPAGYRVDRNRIRLGTGSEAFETAQHALRSWAMFDLGWTRIFPRQAAIQPGTVVAVVASHFGFWSVNLSRIVFVEDPGSFAYGTLDEHAASGEEKFRTIRNASDDSVWYEVLAFSKPNQALARLGYPLARMLQKRFVRDSMAAMQRVTESPRSSGYRRPPNSQFRDRGQWP